MQGWQSISFLWLFVVFAWCVLVVSGLLGLVVFMCSYHSLSHPPSSCTATSSMSLDSADVGYTCQTTAGCVKKRHGLGSHDFPTKEAPGPEHCLGLLLILLSTRLSRWLWGAKLFFFGRQFDSCLLYIFLCNRFFVGGQLALNICLMPLYIQRRKVNLRFVWQAQEIGITDRTKNLLS